MTIDDMIAMLQAAKDGKAFQARVKHSNDPWVDCRFPSWNFEEFEYRVKPAEPEEFYVNIYADGSIGRSWRCKDAAEQAKDLARTVSRTIKVREVLE